MSQCVTINDELKLFTGDVITLTTQTNKYWKRYGSFSGGEGILAYLSSPDQWSFFTVEVVDSTHIRLIADNGQYLKRYTGWKGMDILRFTPDPNQFTLMRVETIEDYKIYLRIDDTGNYMKRYTDYKGKDAIVMEKNTPDDYSWHTITRTGTKCTEDIDNIVYDMDELKETTTPFTIGEQTIENNSDVEQTTQVLVEKEVSTEKTMTWENSFMVGSETSFEAKVPLCGTAGMSMSEEMTFTEGGAESSTDTQSIKIYFPVTCPPHSSVKATSIVMLGNIDVPYTGTVTRQLVDGNTTEEYTYQVSGIYKGVNAFNTHMQVDPIP